MEVLFQRYSGEIVEYFLMMGVRGLGLSGGKKYIIDKKELEPIPNNFKLLGMGYLNVEGTILPVSSVEERDGGKSLLFNLDTKSLDKVVGPGMMRLIYNFGYIQLFDRKYPAYLYKRNKNGFANKK